MGLYLLLLLLTTGALVIGDATVASADCNYYQDISAGNTYYVYSTNYPNRYQNRQDCRWEAVAPSNSRLILTCDHDMTNNCDVDRISVSPSGNASMTDARVYCGYGRFSVESTKNRMVITFTASESSPGGKFLCYLNATVPTILSPTTCECGWKNEARIVGGRETGVNEYPMMAGLVDFNNKWIYCGATVIARRYTLSAAHCVEQRNIIEIGVVVGEHDVTTGAETKSTKLLRVESVIIHPQYILGKTQNDIAVIRVTEDISFSRQVGPACLPFRFPTTSAGTVVDVLGWGLIEFGGKKSDVLMETQLYVVNSTTCQQEYGSDFSTTNQLCTYRPGTDACQMDSGGPVLWMDPANRLQLVGVISNGYGCASESPGINTRVFPYINWIQSVTPDAQYCVR